MVIWLPLILVVIFSPLLIAIFRSIFLRLRYKPPQKREGKVRQIDSLQQSAKNLAKAISFPTISYEEWSKTDLDVFHQFRAFLKETYPTTFSTLQLLDGGDLNILLYWEGEDKELLPALLMAHQDVVAADDADEWRYPPFSETIEEGYVWGRGSFDIKGQLIAILESVERLLKAGIRPQRSWYIAFGCDEEVRGENGAQKIAAYFHTNKIRFAFVLDEGGVVADNFVSFIKKPVAVVGMAEKGFVNISIEVTKEGGHSSSPVNPTPVGLLGRAIWQLERRKFKSEITPPIKEMLTTIGLNSSFLFSIPLLNLWLFKPLIVAIFGSTQATDPLMRTTLAVTMAQGSSAPNVIAPHAKAVANFRLLPTETVEEVLAKTKKRINLKGVNYTILAETPQSIITSSDSPEFEFLKRCIEESFPGAIVSPYLMTGGTDAIWLEPLSDNIFRFSPYRIEAKELKRVHAKDERLAVTNLEKAIIFYSELITQSGHH